MAFKSFRFQLRTQPGIERQLRRFAGSCRWVWNAAIARQKERRAAGEKFTGYVGMCKWLTEWRNAAETAWLAESPVHAQQQALKRLEETYKRFFEGKGGYPRFKGRGQDSGIRFPDKINIRVDANGRIKLPRLGWLRMRQSREVTGELRNATVTQERGRWFVSIQTQRPDVVQAAGLVPTLGIDLGVAVFAATSDGQQVAPLIALKKQQGRLKHAQRSLNRKVKGSRNRRKAVDRLGRIHAKIAAQRNDWLHKLSTGLVKSHPVIAIEDLRVASMTASAAGTVDAPGKNVRQKAGLNRAILDQGWGEFRRQLEYKTAAVGGGVVAVNPAYTSQTCSACGHVSKGNRKTQSHFECEACGHAENADINAAKNILAAGHAVWATGPIACGGDVRRAKVARPKRAAPAKQEPTEVRLA